MNVVNLVGNLGQDPEVRQTNSGNSVANLRLATSHFRGSGDERQEHTEWHNVVLFGKTAEIAGAYTQKGHKIGITGRLQTRKWEDREGNDRYTTEVVGNELELYTKKGERGADTSFEPSQFEKQDEFAAV